MSKRPELRRLQRNAQKKFRPSNAVNNSNDVSNVLFGSQENVMKNFGLNVQELKVYLERMESEMKKDFETECREKIAEAEEYASVANLLITIYAIKMSRKSREHTKDLIHRMLDNYNTATDYIKRVGAKEAYRQLHTDLEVTLEFDSEKMNKEFGFTEVNKE